MSNFMGFNLFSIVSFVVAGECSVKNLNSTCTGPIPRRFIKKTLNKLVCVYIPHGEKA